MLAIFMHRLWTGRCFVTAMFSHWKHSSAECSTSLHISGELVQAAPLWSVLMQLVLQAVDALLQISGTTVGELCQNRWDF